MTMSFDRYFQGKKLSITDGTLQQINDSELDKIFEHAFFNNITDIDLSGNNLTELSIDLLVSISCIGILFLSSPFCPVSPHSYDHNQHGTSLSQGLVML
jgi:hypothetical protein